MTTKPQGKPLKPVERDDKGRIKSGSANPGGMTVEMRQARDAMQLWLCDKPQVDKAREAYVALLEEKNPVIVKDFMDRVAGKVKEQVELSGDNERPLAGLSAEAIIAALRAKPE